MNLYECSKKFRTTLQSMAVLAAFAQASCATQNCDLDAIYKVTSDDCGQKPCPPAPPQEGPASGKSEHGSVNVYELKEGMFDSYRSVVYVPASPTPRKAPVVLFLHGYFDASPDKYDAMLRHYARKGYIVIYPSYGNGLAPKSWASNAEAAWKRAIASLPAKGKVEPDLDQVAYIGHSIGGMLALHLAQKESASRDPAIPVPKLLIAMESAGIPSPAYKYIAIDDLSRIPSSTRLLLIMAQETYENRQKDKDLCESGGKEPSRKCDGFVASRMAFTKTSQIPSDRKAAILIPSDMRGEQGLRSEHNGVQGECGSGKPLDAIDVWGYWRNTVAALDQTFLSPNAAAKPGAGPRTSAKWSDGQAAKSEISLDNCFTKSDCPTI
jgi:acetyl esterase/lipase